MDSRKSQQPQETALLETARKHLPAAITGPTAALSGALTAKRGSAGEQIETSFLKSPDHDPSPLRLKLPVLFVCGLGEFVVSRSNRSALVALSDP